MSEYVLPPSGPGGGAGYSTCCHPMDFTVLCVVNGRAEVRGHFSYDSRDPYTVRAFFARGEDDFVEWVFGRELLADGLLRAAGHGDIRIRPSSDDHALIVIELTSPFGTAVLAAPRQALDEFLACAAEIVPLGEEHRLLDWDSELERLLAGER
ncbi:sporulation protein SsgA [Amycolatopsis sp. WAC 04169]|uniref:SsgA family sporulation/cell division regulator n=1 Tax=Amycolatopsis sp. WAC 04169 TaxID=2203197 RepID=UPI000F786040|nr:SsgA family sporulation/cell division regulator [Amycolatopsis sp. WAC 04169]RSN19279.1 sporulation protein SsgA [Amycolatopsis sp. WAC 04169]